jgi:hypothetical protein
LDFCNFLLVYTNYRVCDWGCPALLKIIFAIFKMRAIFKSVWVRKLIGKLGVPYNRRLGVRPSSHPLFYSADLSLPAAESNAFRI